MFKTFCIAALFCSIFCLVISCKKKQDTPALFELQTPNKTNINFTNQVENSKDFNIFSYRNFYNGGGVAIGDINNDGFADVFFTANMGANKLYVNKGNFNFDDISLKAGIEEKGKWNTGVVMVDINNDGWLDIYVCNAGIDKWKNKDGNKLFINNKNLTFTEKAAEYGLDDKGYTTHAAFFDYDLDGDLDCYILNNSFIPVNTLNYSNKRTLPAENWPVEDFAKGGGDKLLRNDAGKFIDVTTHANIYSSLIGFGLGITVSDVNNDHYPDLYVSNDFFERDYLYINQQNGTFKEQLPEQMNHTSLASMGADAADINNDGFPDIFTTDMLPADDKRLKTTASFDTYEVYQYKRKQGFYEQIQQNTLQINNGNNKFFETAQFSGVAGSDWSWGALCFDANNDGLSDIYVCNGIYKDVIDQDFIDFFANDIIQKMALSGEKEDMQKIIDSMPSNPIKNKFFKNNGNLSFSDEGERLGFNDPSFSNGAAYGDLDNDGDLDLVVNNVNMPSFVYKNKSIEQKAGNYINVSLIGNNNNLFAIGSTIKLYTGNEILSRELYPARGFQSSIDYKINIGLGNKKIDSIVVYWPDKKISTITNAIINSSIVIDYNKILKKDNYGLAANDNINTMFKQVQTNFDKHNEDEFVDFFQERNMPIMLSKEGPKAAVADVNNDGLEDVFIGGAKNQAGQLYLQSNKGFVKTQSALFEKDSIYEDIAITFFDVDNDNDKDLWISAGGNNLPPNHVALQHRLYINNGKGIFNKYANTLPQNMSNVSVVLPFDYDQNGTLDLFIGGRNNSYNYGLSASSYILKNDGKGNFTDVTQTVAPQFKALGMVTDAVVGSINSNATPTLLVVGEWMYPMAFEYKDNRFTEVKTNLQNHYGWWQKIDIADIDKDGMNDIILGNIGENFYLKPNATAPVKLWINDFDKNGIAEKVFSRTVNNQDVPVFLKREFTDALPSFKKENLRHRAFANKTMQTLFTANQISTSTIKQFTYASSCIAFNNNNNNFTLVNLPSYAQLSSVNTLACVDINKDGLKDIVLGGNMADCLPQFGRLDASFSTVFLNKGNRNFTYITNKETAITITGVIRDIKPIIYNKQSSLLFLRNNDFPQLYTY
jgi:enediyne biosynthesis protein E4